MNLEYISMPVVTGLSGIVINYKDVFIYFAMIALAEEKLLATLNLKDLCSTLDLPLLYVQNSIMRLKRLKFIISEKNQNCLTFDYEFPKLKTLYMKIPSTLLTMKLKFEEKAMLLLAKLYCLESDMKLAVDWRYLSQYFTEPMDQQLDIVKSLTSKKLLKFVYDRRTNELLNLKLMGSVKWKCAENDWIYEIHKAVMSDLNVEVD